MTYIQFIGTQRSGSNLLRVMLNQLPEISAPHPPHILKTFIPLLSRYGNLEIHDNFYKLIKDVCDWVNKNPVPWTGVFFNPEAIAQQCSKPTLFEVFTALHRAKAVADGAFIWCCKSMESVYHLNEIEQSGLRPFYIYLYRDGRDVALSFKKSFVGPKHVYHSAKKWKQEQELSINLLKSMEEERYMMIKYEDFIHNHEGVLALICQKLGIQFSSEVFDYYKSKESLNAASSGDMWINLSKPILRDNFNKYKVELTPEEIEIFEKIAGDTLNSLGYETCYWPFAGSVKFSPEEIKIFDKKNQEEIQAVRATKAIDEIKKRQPQEELLKKIMDRERSMEQT